MNFKQILQTVRIDRAEFLLLDTSLTVTNIGIEVGYDTTEHFIRTFKKLKGMTPSTYRNEYSSTKATGL